MNTKVLVHPLASGEAVGFLKKSLLFLFLFFGHIAFAQIDVSVDQLRQMPETQLLKYYNAAKAQGYSTQQILELARLKGATPTELMELKEKIKALEGTLMNPTATDNLPLETAPQATFGIQPQDSIDVEFSPVYGSEFFNNPKIEFSPSMQLATPRNYQLGPGDTLVIELYGASASTYTGEISPSGTLSIEGIAPVYLSGRTLAAAKKKLTTALAAIYEGLKSTDPTTKVQLEVNLQSARTVLVQVVGQAKVPGTYALSGFSTPLHALYAAGGINFNGSYRNITLQRNGRVVTTLDVYEFLSSGMTSDKLLRDGDILFIPYYESRVEVMGAVKKRGLFEPKEGESLLDFTKHFGGFLPSADPNTLTIDRQVGTERKLLTFSASSFDTTTLANGDRIIALERFSSYNNKVVIEGAVVAPGVFALETTATVGALLEKSGGLQRNAVRQFATLYREVEGLERAVRSLRISTPQELQTPLTAGDRLVIYDQEALKTQAQITLEGAVNAPGNYPFFEGMEVSDAIAMAEGLTDKADDQTIAIYKNFSDGSTQKGYQLKAETSFSLLSTTAGVALAPDDVIVVGVNPRRIAPEFVEIQGEVFRPGKYLLEEVDASVTTLVQKAMRSNKAALTGVYILRKQEQELNVEGSKEFNAALEEASNLETVTLEKNSDVSTMQKDNAATSPEYIKIPISLTGKNKTNPSLLSGDIVIVEPINNSIQIKGAVQQPTVTNSTNYSASAKHYINAAGGFSSKALRKNVFVIAQNGSIKATRSLLFLKFYPKVSPGATVVVPERSEQRTRATFQEIMGVATSLATFGIIIDRLLQ